MGLMLEVPSPVKMTGCKFLVDNVSRRFKTPQGNWLWALRNISFDVPSGEFLCIVGPSGCGKSALLHLIAGLDRPSEGRVWLDGRQVDGTGPDRMLIFQELGLFPWLTARENVEFGLRLKGVRKPQRKEHARRYLSLVQLSPFEEHYIHELSGGMKQRVALARALAAEPEVLLMDEPFAALDAQTRDLLHDELERVWKETAQTIVFVTHNVREAVRLGDRVLVLSDRPGRIMHEFSIALPRPRHIEDAEVARTAKKILGHLRAHIDKSFRAEYQHE